MRNSFVALAAALVILRAAGWALGEEAGETHVDATAVCNVASVKAGDSFTVAVVLKAQAGWHIYWRNPGDAGLATEFQLSLPEGCKAEPPLPAYPLPTQFNQPGNIVAYGYEGTAVFLIRVSTAKELGARKNVEIKVKASWLSCNSERCVPGGKDLALTIPVAGSTTAATANAALFENARKEMPADAPPADEVTATSLRPAGASGAVMTVQLDWKKNAPGEVAAFPLAVDGLELSAAKIETEHNRTRVAFKAKVLAGQQLTSGDLPVLIVYTDAGGKRRGFYTSLALPAAAVSHGK